MIWAGLIAGGFIAVLLSYVFVLAKFYQACEMDEALVRSGAGGPKVAIQGGIWKLPYLHKFQKVTLRTLKLDIKTGTVRSDDEATAGNEAEMAAVGLAGKGIKRGMGVMRSKDHLPIVLDAEIYVHVPPKEDYVIAAARTLGEKADPSQGVNEEAATEAIKTVTREKLVSAIRGVAATMTLDEMHSERLRFTDNVANHLEQDLKENGLELEAVTIESLDQEPLSGVEKRAGEGNVFDEGALTALISRVEQHRTRRNQAKQTELLAREQQDTQYTTGSLALQKEREFAVATQEREVANKKVEETASIETFEAETNRDKTLVVEDSQLVAYSKIESAAQELEVLQSDLEQTKRIKIAENEELYGVRELDRDQRLETKEETVKETIETAAIQRVQSVATRANESREAVGIRQKQAVGAIQVAGEEANLLVTAKEREVADAKSSTHTAQAEAERALASIATARTEEELRASIEAKAAAKRKEAEELSQIPVIEAEAQRRAAVEEAAAEVATANGTRDARLAIGSAADAVIADGRAQAESQRLENEAYAIRQEADLLAGDTVVPYMLSKNAPALAGHLTNAVAAAFKPLENIDGMRILQVNTDGAGGSSGSPLNDVLKNITNNAPAGAIINEMLEMSGTDLTVRDLLEKLVGGAAKYAGVSSIIDSDENS